MCGIVGFTGNRQAAPILLDGLSKLEYRGYDSAGLAVRDGENLAQVVKAKGRLSNLMEKTDNGNALKGTCGIGHTRWATHGEPSQTNAHPHVSGNCTRSGSGAVESEVVGVHNGIIENYTELKEKLLKHGYTFYSQTDTEVVIKLVDYYYKKYNLGPIDAIAKTMVRVRGSYALELMFRDYPGEIWVARKDSPMIIGIADGETYVASDVPAILKYTCNVYYIGNLEFAKLTPGEAHFYDLNGDEIEKQTTEIKWDAEAAEKGGFEHFMMKEIHEQPKAVQDTLNSVIKNDVIDLSRDVYKRQILFYSFSEWVLYATDPHLAEMGSIQDWAGVYPLFHWSFIPWGFYLVLAVAFGFMLHVRKRNRQKYSEACRPILGKYTDGWAGRIIDLLAVFALLAGTATTFSVATPLMATIISELFHVAVSRTVINIIILLITCAVYTYSLLHGFKGISKLANICIYMFFGLIAFVLLFGGETRYIIETGFSSLGRMIQNFVDLSTFTDPLRTSNFPQNWTIYYWAYWMVWCVAAPFFIGSISRGRTVRQTILGGYIFGVGSTLTSFIVLGNYSMGMQVTGKADFIAQYLESGDLYGMIVSIIKTMPGAPVIMVVVLLTMIAFYATSFDSIALTASCYSYHTLRDGEQPNKVIQLMWCILLILLPIALLFAESSMNNLQSVSIVAAFPIGVVIVMIAVSFMKDAKKYMQNMEEKGQQEVDNVDNEK